MCRPFFWLLKSLSQTCVALSYAGTPYYIWDLEARSSFTDAGLAALREMPLTDLSMVWCVGVTGTGLSALSGLPLRRLDLTFCTGLRDVGMEALRGLPIVRLNLHACWQITPAVIEILLSLPLTWLRMPSPGCQLAIECRQRPELAGMLA